MYTIDESVKHQETGKIGKVIGYGHQILNDVYTVTLKVIVVEAANSPKRLFVLEDILSAWSH